MRPLTPERDGEPAPPRLDENLCFTIYSANLAFNRVYRPLLERLDLTYVQYMCMVALWLEDGIGVGALGDRLFLASNTLTPVLKRLEALGYLRRSRHPADERQVRLTLTAEGRALRARAAAVPGCVGAATGLSAAEAAELGRMLATLRDQLLASAGAPPAP